MIVRNDKPPLKHEVLETRGLDFEDAPIVFTGLRRITWQDNRRDYGERREIAMGELAGRLIVIAHTKRTDIPELPEVFFTEGQLYRDGNRVERHVYDEQQLAKKQLTLKINDDVIDFFKRQGVGWQMKINDVLQQYVDSYQTA